MAFLLCGRANAASLDVQVPTECGSRTEFEREVEDRLGDDFRAPPARVLIRRGETGYRLTMRVGNERRELEDGNCRELFRAAIVVLVAVALSDTRSADPATKAGRAEPPQSPRTRPSAFAFGLSLGGGAGLGLLPDPVPAAELGAQLLSRERFGIGLGARYLSPAEEEDGAGRGVNVRAWGGHVVGLFYPIPALETRLGVSAYQLSGIALGSPEKTRDSAWAGGPLAGVAFFPFRRETWLGLGAEFELHIVRSRFEIRNYREVFSVPAAGGFAFLRVGRLFL